MFVFFDNSLALFDYFSCYIIKSLDVMAPNELISSYKRLLINKLQFFMNKIKTFYKLIFICFADIIGFSLSLTRIKMLLEVTKLKSVNQQVQFAVKQLLV